MDYGGLAQALAAYDDEHLALALLLFGVIVVCGLLVRDLFARNVHGLLNAGLFVGLLTVLIGLGIVLSEGRSARQFVTGSGYALAPLNLTSSSGSAENSPQGIQKSIESLLETYCITHS